MRGKEFEHVAALIEESARHAAGHVDLTDDQVAAFMREFVEHFTFVLQNSPDDLGGRRFNPYAFAAAAGYPMAYPCEGLVDDATQLAANRYAAGASLAEVAGELGQAVAATRDRLVAAGVEIRKR